MEKVTDQEVALVMIRFGGSFVCCLGKAFQHADPTNAAKIKSTWPEYWESYSEKAEELKKKGSLI